MLNRILEPAPGMHPVNRAELIAGWPPLPSHMPGDLWLLAALGAHG